MMEPWSTQPKKDIIKFIIGKNYVYKIRLDTIVSKMINKIVNISRSPNNLLKTTLQKNLTNHYLEISKKGDQKFVSI